MTDALRVLFLIDSLRTGGKERQAISLVQGLAQRGVQVLVVCMGEDTFFKAALKRPNIRVEHLLRRWRWDIGMLVRLGNLMQEFQPDLLHTTCWMTSFYALLLGKLRGVPVLNGSIRNCFGQGDFRWKGEWVLLRLCDARISNSRAGFLSRGFQPGARGNYVVYNGFDFARMSQTESSVQSALQNLASGRKIVGMVAQFRDDKDYPTYMDAARLVLQERSDVLFVAVGDGKNLEEIRRVYGASSPHIIFLGRERAVESVISTFSIGVLATFTEGISNAIMEYMAAAKPVIATDGGGTAELVVEGITGYLVPPREPQILAEKIEFLLEHPEVGDSLGRAGAQRLREQFSLERLVEGTLETYRSVLNSSSKHHGVAVEA
jgi:glycosyltransferase involved in cell wall biosynthesis